jgi:tight adherence protein B
MPELDLWMIYALAFGAVLLGVQGIYWFFSRTQIEAKAINRRLELSERLHSATETLDKLRRERGLGGGTGLAMFAWLEELVLQTGLRVEPMHLLVLTIGSAAALFLVIDYLVGYGVFALALAPILAAATIYLALRIIRARRITRFGEQFPEALDALVRSLLAGHPFRVALGLIAREMPDPVGTEFGIVADEVAFGLDLTVAVDNLVRRVGHEDLPFFAIAVTIQTQTGGNLAEILSGLARLVRNRIRLRLKVRALSSEGRLSAVFLSLAPFILFGLITLISPSYFVSVQNHPIVVPALVGALALLAIGNVIIYRMVHFKV